jgi:hypothetical protein
MSSSAIVLASLGGTAIGAVGTTSKPTAGMYYAKTSASEITVQIRQLVNSEIIRLIIDNSGGKRITVTISDFSGTMINQTVASKNEKQIVRDFNFASAEDGTYKLEIYDGKTTVRKEIHLKRVTPPVITQLSVQ